MSWVFNYTKIPTTKIMWMLRLKIMYVLLGVLKARYGTQSPGPMVYGARTTFGPQAASKNRTAPVINFTKGLRERVPYTTFQCIHVKELYIYNFGLIFTP
jgi:hypothetical protein